MKRFLLFVVLLSIFIMGCNQDSGESFLVTDGLTVDKTFTARALRDLGEQRVEHEGVTYIGATLFDVLVNAGIDPLTVTTVEAIAADNASAEYNPQLLLNPETLVAYEQADGPLAEDESPFRMVLPGQGEELNVRQLIEIRVSQ